MNVRFLLKIPIKLDGASKAPSAVLTLDTMLDPYLISETALMAMFMNEEEYPTYGKKAREIAFNASVRAWEFTKFKLLAMPEEHKILLTKELALCIAMSNFAKHFYRGFQDSLHRSKTYGEFSVTTTVKNNPAALQGIMKDSDKCLADIKDEIEEMETAWNGLGLSNLKGSWNPGQTWSWRLWFHNNLPERSKQIYASESVWHWNGNRYKGGTDVSSARAYYQGRAGRPSIYNY